MIDDRMSEFTDAKIFLGRRLIATTVVTVWFSGGGGGRVVFYSSVALSFLILYVEIVVQNQ